MEQVLIGCCREVDGKYPASRAGKSEGQVIDNKVSIDKYHFVFTPNSRIGQLSGKPLQRPPLRMEQHGPRRHRPIGVVSVSPPIRFGSA
jgi:hypothetical protein